MEELSLIQKIVVWALPVLLAITVHEVAHGWVAMIYGDNTAKMLGRLTLNPIKHIDPVGTILVPGLLLVFGGFMFGWAKPVPVNWKNLKNPKRDMALVALAGPLANLCMAIAWAALIKFGIWLSYEYISLPLIYMGGAGVLINLVLMTVNLLPIPPLDGGRIATGILPGPIAWKFSRIEPYGLIIIILLMTTGLLAKLIGYPIFVMQKALMAMAGLSY